MKRRRVASSGLRRRLDELERRDAILGAIAHAGALFLHVGNWSGNLQSALDRLRDAIGVSRVSLWENRPSPEPPVTAALRCQSPRLDPTPHHQPPYLTPYEPEFPRWSTTLASGGIIVGLVRHLPPDERTVLEAKGILSLLVAPIFVQGRWWGHISLHDDTQERVWSHAETDALTSAATLLGAAIEREEVQVALARSEELFRTVTETARDAIYMKDTDRRYTLVNPALEQVARTPRETLVGKTDEELFGPDVAGASAPPDRRTLEGNIVELDAVHGLWGTATTFHVIQVPLRTPGGAIAGLCGIARDIADRIRTEQRLRLSLEEKEILLREIHHRVKNNLQVISSLLSLQADTSPESVVRSVLAESRGRVRSMALVHERLYRSPDLAHVEFDSYARSLVGEICKSYTSMGVACSVEMDRILLAVDTALPCGLLLNELVCNAFKHGFPGGGGGTVTVEVRRTNGTIRLRVRDSGVGIPQSVWDAQPTSLGLILIRNLVAQLGGSLSLENDPGAVITVEFPDRQEDHAG